MAKRRAKEMSVELAALASCKERAAELRTFGEFSEDHLGMIEAQISTIGEDLSDAKIEERWGWDPGEGSGALFNSNEDREISKAAKDARRWIDGENDLAPSLRWRALIEEIEG